MKIVVPDLTGVTVSTKGVAVDLADPKVLAWLDLLAHYRQKLAVQPYVEPEVPHVPPPQINALLGHIFKGQK